SGRASRWRASPRRSRSWGRPAVAWTSPRWNSSRTSGCRRAWCPRKPTCRGSWTTRTWTWRPRACARGLDCLEHWTESNIPVIGFPRDTRPGGCMEFGLFSNGHRRSRVASPTYEEDLFEIVTADKVGMHEAWISEHIGLNRADTMPTPELLI